MDTLSSEATDRLELPPLAIIGVACRFPGGAEDPEAFWKLLQDEVDAIGEIPPSRFDADYYYDPRPGVPGKIICREGGFVQNIDRFDPSFFGISPREAAVMDPQQRLLLEVTWEALEDGGQIPEKLTGSRTGVFVGVWTNDYETRMCNARDDIDFHSLIGGARYSAAGRVSFIFDFRGPSLIVDTACSSSLVSVHLACQSLWNGETTLAVAGGVNLILEPHINIGGATSNMLTPDGRCRFGDARANGYVRSEGVGVVIIKPFAQALADNDPIYALIRGSAVNSDGNSSGLLASPSIDAQIAVLRKAYGKAGVPPGRVSYVEAHGTGTSVGDPVEVKALSTVLGEGRAPERPFAIGSVKTNIGHTEAAAGVAGVIKASLCLKHRAIPASLHFEEPNPNIPWSELPVVMQKSWGAWPEEPGPAFAGVNSFGITGTNVHLVLQSAPPATECGQENEPDGSAARLIPLSAHTPEALQEMARRYVGFLREQKDDFSLRDFAYTRALRRTHHDCRLALVAHDREELVEQLSAFLEGEARRGIASGREDADRQKQPVFVFSGMGPQWWAMGRELWAKEAVFHQAIENVDSLFQPLAGWSIVDELMKPEEESRVNQISVGQPAVFAVQVGLTALWQSWNISPAAIVGHSTGEVAAAYASGCLTLSDAVKVIYHRSRLQQLAAGKGTMAAVGLSVTRAKQLLSDYDERVSIAAVNSPNSVTLSGDDEVLAEVTARLEEQDIFVRYLHVDTAYHSAAMDCIREQLPDQLEDIESRPATVPTYSTVSGQLVDSDAYEANYWWRNVRESVNFAKAIDQIIVDGYRNFLELSPHPVLARSIIECLRHENCEGTVLPSLRRKEEERAVMLSSLGTLYAHGADVSWSELHPEGRPISSLPTYPWQRERLWYEEAKVQTGPNRRRLPRINNQHPLLGQHTLSAVHSETHLWELELDTTLFPYLDDHRVGGMAVFPAAAYVEMALEAAREIYGSGAQVLEDIQFQEALFLSGAMPRLLQLVISPSVTGQASFQLFSRPSDEERQAEWTLHAAGVICVGQEEVDLPQHNTPSQIQAQCQTDISAAEHYRLVSQRKLQYGPYFQGVQHVWQGSGEALGELHLAEPLEAESKQYYIHPTVLDSALQVLLAGVHNHPSIAPDDSYLPTGFDSLCLYTSHEDPHRDGEIWAYAKLHSIQAEALKGDVFLLDGSGQIILEARGVHVQQLERNTQEMVNEWLYDIEWQAGPLASPAAEPEDAAGQPGHWLILADRGGVADRLQSRLTEHGATCTVISRGRSYRKVQPNRYVLDPVDPASARQLLSDVVQEQGRVPESVLHLWSLDAAPPAETTLTSLAAAQELGCISVLHLVQALVQGGWQEVPSLWLVSGGAQPVAPDQSSLSVAQSQLWGLGKVIAQEHPELNCKLIDISLEAPDEELDGLIQELQANQKQDNHVALRGDARCVARLVRRHLETGEIARDSAVSPPPLAPAGERSFHLEIGESGRLDSLLLRSVEPPGELPSGTVCLEVRATGLNFKDVLHARGKLPSSSNGAKPLGVECAGEIVAVGDGVENWAPGDKVIALAPDCFGTHAVTDARLVAPKPEALSFAEAVTIPAAFITAYYTLCHLAGLRQGERVLIHAATGGVGMAALQVARQAGAQVFATAGSPHKREFLRDLGVPVVMDSRSLDFADEVLEYTDGQGVDVVLNSLAGEFLWKSLSTLAPYGRFIEIGQRDILENSQIGLRPFQKNRSFFAFNLEDMCYERPELVGRVFHEVMGHFAEGTFTLLPSTPFFASQIVDAFRYMDEARHVGKVVITFDETDIPIAPSRSQDNGSFRANATYLITGGLGGLGLTVAQWMMQQGAKHLVLLGRSGASQQTEPILEKMRNEGADVVVAAADVTSEEQLAKVLTEIEQTLPPLQGVIHAAGVLDDSTLLQLNQERFCRVTAPKIDGAWNLHTLTLDKALDFFILFSSAASLIGTLGQGNYVAANTFLDSLAHYRHRHGLPALSINWGAWSDVGLAAAQANRGQRLASQGLASMSPQQGIAALEKIWDYDQPQIGVMVFDPQKWQEFHPQTAEWSFLERLAAEQVGETEQASSPQTDSSIRERLQVAQPAERRSLLEARLQEQTAGVLKLSPSRIKRNATLQSLGFDSLMALELRSRLEADFGISLSATVAFNYPSVTALASHIASKLKLPLENGEGASEAMEPLGEGAVADQIDETDETILQLLQEAEGVPEDELRQMATNRSAED